MKKQNPAGYLSQASIYSQPQAGGDAKKLMGTIAFICDDDLWTVGLDGGRAHRITANLGVVAEPAISRDGDWIAFAGTDGGQKDIYRVDIQGGRSERLTYMGISKLIGWKDKDTLLYTSAHESTSLRIAFIYELDLRTLDSKRLPYGPATDVSFGKNGQIVLGRHCRDSALWKRYKGGTAGVLWVGKKGGKFQRILKNIKSNLTNPHFIDDEIYFLSDFEGVAQVYRTTSAGKI
jgi:tricorn protease